MKEKQFLVIGLGRFGSALAKELYEMGHEVLGVDEDEENVKLMDEFLTHGIVGDVTNESFFSSIGVQNFDAAIIAIGSDYEASIMAVSQAKEYKVKRVIAKARDINHMKVLYRLGADKVVIPEREMGKRLAHSLWFSGNIIETVELSDDFSIVEINARPEWWNKTLADAHIRSEANVTVLAVRRGDTVEVNPSASYEIRRDDHLFVLGGTDDVRRLEQNV